MAVPDPSPLAPPFPVRHRLVGAGPGHGRPGGGGGGGRAGRGGGGRRCWHPPLARRCRRLWPQRAHRQPPGHHRPPGVPESAGTENEGGGGGGGGGGGRNLARAWDGHATAGAPTPAALTKAAPPTPQGPVSLSNPEVELRLVFVSPLPADGADRPATTGPAPGPVQVPSIPRKNADSSPLTSTRPTPVSEMT